MCRRVSARPDRPGVRSPSRAPTEALEYFRFRGLRTGFDYRDVWQEEHALVFTVAKAMDNEVLDEIRAALDRALGEGQTLRQFRKELTPVLQKRGWWGKKEMEDPLTGEAVPAQLGSHRRLRTIYRANLRAARAAAVWDRAQRTETTAPYFLYEPGPGKRCARHAHWAGTILPVDDRWWDDHFPPNGWGCKCRVHQVGAVEAEHRGGVTEPPPRKEVSWWNKRAGRFEQVDEGLDPAWATNPGKHRALGPLGCLHQKLDAADRSFARAAIASVLDSPILPQFRAAPRGDLLGGLVEPRVQRAWKSKTLLARLPDRIMDKQERRHWSAHHRGHPELTDEDYRRLPDIIGRPDHVFVAESTPPEHRENRLDFFREVDGERYLLVAEHSPESNKIEIISFRKSSRRRGEIHSLLRRAIEILPVPKD